MYIVNISEAKTHLTQLVKRVLAGEDIVIAKQGEPMVRLSVYQTDLTPREGGQMRGQIWMSEDFDAPDPELEALFYDSPIEPVKTLK
jgi:antitoxin (DNA-binding transcriptional repressor) of toxin-antitoxin stability system